MTQHTQGGWNADEKVTIKVGSSGWHGIYGQDYELLAFVNPKYAALIAAAPKLLALCEARLHSIELEAHNSGDDPTAIDSDYDAIRAAITTAEGE